ncbi:MAG: homoserine dehydrogenase [Elusimicrobiota bacterium]
MKKINLGLIGFGTVGAGAIKIIQSNLALLEKKIGAKIELVKICDKDLSSPRPGVKLNPKMLTSDYHEIINDPSIDIVVELIGGYEPARTIILEAMAKGKHIVTANKALMAKYWDEILTAARANQVLVYFEASVGGGIPVIQSLNEGLAANHILSIAGILNGTTNYILTKMTREGINFSHALKMAQSAGFAEADARFDLEGIDAAHKLSILASIAFGSWVKLENIACQGINQIDCRDLVYAQEFGYILKLIGMARNKNGEIEIRVAPTLISPNHPFANVENEYNAILIHGDAVGDVMLYGKGAGQMAAASAVVSDIIFLARQVNSGMAGKIPYVTYDRKKKLKFLPEEKSAGKYYLRFTTEDKPGVLATIAGLLGKNDVSIASVSQKQKHPPQKGVPILIITHRAKEGDVVKSLKLIDKLSVVRAKTVIFRIEEKL